jgi:ribosomal protein S6--L-glutamate ligase
MMTLDHLRCDLMIEKGQPTLYYDDQKIQNVSAVIPRIGSSATIHGEAVVRHFQAMNIYSTLNADGLIHARDKYRAYQILAAQDILVPKSALSSASYTADTLLRQLGEPPYIIKLVNSTHGAGVLKAETFEMAMAMIEAFSRARQRLIFQEYIEESAGEDIRVFIVDNKVVACMKRRAQSGDFRSNLHRGGTSEIIKLSDEEEYTSLKSCQILGLDVAGVDILRSSRGPMVLEVNASPGLEGIEGTTRIDIANKIISMVEKKVKNRG